MKLEPQQHNQKDGCVHVISENSPRLWVDFGRLELCPTTRVRRMWQRERRNERGKPTIRARNGATLRSQRKTGAMG